MTTYTKQIILAQTLTAVIVAAVMHYFKVNIYTPCLCTLIILSVIITFIANLDTYIYLKPIEAKKSILDRTFVQQLLYSIITAFAIWSQYPFFQWIVVILWLLYATDSLEIIIYIYRNKKTKKTTTQPTTTK